MKKIALLAAAVTALVIVSCGRSDSDKKKDSATQESLAKSTNHDSDSMIKLMQDMDNSSSGSDSAHKADSMKKSK